MVGGGECSEGQSRNVDGLRKSVPAHSILDFGRNP